MARIPPRSPKPKAGKKAARPARSSKKPPAKKAAVKRPRAVKAVVAAPPPPALQGGDAALKFAVEVAKLAVADKCRDVVVLDVRGLSPVTDFQVIASATSGRQMKTAADDAIELGRTIEFPPLSTTGTDGENWVCVDFVDVVLHVFSTDSRQYYDLESLWGDAKRVEIA
jgi:ribosome-associated protein